jgi:putative oxidoreductase
MTNLNNQINSFFAPKKEFGASFIRIMVAFHLIYGVQDNVFSWERMLEFRNFLEANSFPFPLFCAVLSVYAQLICGLAFIAGLFTRPAALIMVINFVVAILMIHIGTPYPPAFPAIAMLCCSLFLLFNGPGKWSIDNSSTFDSTRTP